MQTQEKKYTGNTVRCFTCKLRTSLINKEEEEEKEYTQKQIGFLNLFRTFLTTVGRKLQGEVVHHVIG